MLRLLHLLISWGFVLLKTAPSSNWSMWRIFGESNWSVLGLRMMREHTWCESLISIHGWNIIVRNTMLIWQWLYVHWLIRILLLWRILNLFLRSAFIQSLLSISVGIILVTYHRGHRSFCKLVLKLWRLRMNFYRLLVHICWFLFINWLW